MLSVCFVQDWGSLMHAIKQAWWEWIHPFCLWVCFCSLRDMKECLIQAKQAKHDNLTTNHNDFCMLFLLQLSAQVEAWSVLLLEARMIYYYYASFVHCCWSWDVFLLLFLPFWFVCFSLLAWFYSSTHQSSHDSSSTSSSVLPFVSGLQQYFMGCVKVLSFDLVLGWWGKNVGIILFSLM